jgi:CMP-N-acetylneuraminic acid synthetase
LPLGALILVARPKNSPSLVAFVPMRHESERVPGKNYRDFCGSPLYAHILKTLSNVPEINLIAVDTDSEIIGEGVRERFPDVRLLSRPEHLRSGETPMNEVLLHDVRTVEAEYYLQTHSTNPLLRAETVRRAVQVFLNAHPGHDSLFGVTKRQTRLWSVDGQPVNHDPDLLLRTQDLEPFFEENSCLYLFERETFLQRRNRIGIRPFLFEVAAEEAIDIDDEYNFTIAECLGRSHLAS